MRIRHFDSERFHLDVPFGGKKVSILADPPGLLPLLADAGLCGLVLVEEASPVVWEA